MNKNQIDINFCLGVAPNLQRNLIEKILRENSQLSADELIDILISKNEEFDSESYSEIKQELLTDDDIFTRPCRSHNSYTSGCTYYHDEIEKRRPQKLHNYIKKPCRHG